MEAGMFKNILLCTDGSPAAKGATDAAIWFACKLGARLQALYVTDVRLLEGPLLADLSGALGAAPYPALLPQFKNLEDSKAETIFRAVTKLAGDSGVPLTTAHVTGNLTHAVLDHERESDLLVLGQRGEHAPWHGEMIGTSVERIVRSSVKPCLIVPEKFGPPSHVLIAYDGSTESAKGLRLGLDLATTLSTPVTLVTACRREHEEEASKSLKQANAMATSRKLSSRAQLVRDNPETAILHECNEAHADLIVMGAYGHTRIRELILGSTTSHIIRKAPVPVLLARGQSPENHA
jgi:nucleotide-binding universal stress UspA family protein